MRALFALTALSLALMGCNGGEDFSDATVPGCPAGAPCDESSRGEVLVELVGPRVDNLGYRCSGSEVLFRTSEAEQTSVTSDGQEVIVPPFNALCPATSREIEFFIGSDIFEGNNVNVGRFSFPQTINKSPYQITLSDVVSSPVRASLVLNIDTNDVLNRAALLQALDEDQTVDDVIQIPDAAHQFIDENYDDVVGDTKLDGYTSYGDFTADWEGVVNGVNAIEPVYGFADPDVSTFEQRQLRANARTRAGLYAFENPGECLFFVGCQLETDSEVRVTYSGKMLVLPDGSVLSGGFALISDPSAAGENTGARTEFDFIGFDSNASVSDLMELTDSSDAMPGITLLGAGIDSQQPTDAIVSGKYLGQTMYAGISFSGGPTDYENEYPGATHSLQDSEKGKLDGELLGEDYTNSPSSQKAISVRSTQIGVVQEDPDTSLYAGLEGEYTLRLMRACVDDDLGDDGSACSSIPSPSDSTPDINEEITPPAQDEEGNTFIPGNYPVTLGGIEITEERMRVDFKGNAEMCITIETEGEDSLLKTGFDGTCGTDLTVGFVTRTFGDPASANVAIFMAPGLDVEPDVAHYNAYIEGRIDLRSSSDGCARMYRLSDENFERGLRAKWEEPVFLPTSLAVDFGEDATDAERRRASAVASGAVQFFANEPGCDPLAP